LNEEVKYAEEIKIKKIKTQVDLAFHSWDGKMSTSQRAVMLCGWEKCRMACSQVKLCVAISERFRKCIWYLKALFKYPGLLLLYFSIRLSKLLASERC